MSMLALNEDFAYSISPLGRGSKSSFTPSRAATTNLIDGQRYDSVMNKYAEVCQDLFYIISYYFDLFCTIGPQKLAFYNNHDKKNSFYY